MREMWRACLELMLSPVPRPRSPRGIKSISNVAPGGNLGRNAQPCSRECGLTCVMRAALPSGVAACAAHSAGVGENHFQNIKILQRLLDGRQEDMSSDESDPAARLDGRGT